MGPVRQNPIERTVSLFICVCIALCTIVAHNIAQNRPDSFPPYPPDNHHISDDVYLREGGYGRKQYSSSNTQQSYHSWRNSITLTWLSATCGKCYHFTVWNAGHCCNTSNRLTQQLVSGFSECYVNIAAPTITSPTNLWMTNITFLSPQKCFICTWQTMYGDSD